MALVDDAFEVRWQWGDWFETPPAYVGRVKPTLRIALRRGSLVRGFDAWDPRDDFATIPGQSVEHPWQATWTPSEDYIDVPGALDMDLAQDFTANGLTRATITVENVVMVEQTGALGHIFRTIERGYLSPWRGYQNDSLHYPLPHDAKNEWFQRLNRNVQITAWAGYGGDFEVPVWTGLVDDLDMTSKPSKITVSARDFGQVLTDQPVFGHIRGPNTVREPVVFADRLKSTTIVKAAARPKASSHEKGYPAAKGIDGNNKTRWISGGHGTADHSEWFQFTVPKGKYERLYLYPAFSNMELFVSAYVRDKGLKGSAHAFDEPVPNGWLDLPGHGYVTNDDGETIPFIRHIKATRAKGTYYNIVDLSVGDGTEIRLTFKKLRRWKGDGRYHAGVVTTNARHRKLKPVAKKSKLILVDDVTDVAKVLLRWAGFKEWEVETAGVRLKENFVVTRDNMLMDPIKKITEQTGFVFFMGDPTLWESSIGVPTLRHNSVFGEPSDPMRVLRDTDLLTGVNVKITDDPLKWPIFVRGRLGKGRGDKEARSGVGLTNFFGEPKRVGAKIYPPWRGRMAGVMKHAFHYDTNLKTDLECLMACYLLALNMAMQSATAIVELPANPGIGLDEQVIVKDTATGLQQRLYVAQRNMTLTRGENASFTMTLGGSLIDTPDIQGVLDAMNSVDWGDDDDATLPVVATGGGDGVIHGEEVVVATGSGGVISGGGD